MNMQSRKIKILKIWKPMYEYIILIIICFLIFFLSTLQTKNILSIWNQNDEFGVWQGAAWILGYDWSEVASANGYYGYGYGFVLAIFLKLFGNNTILMTRIAIYFQALVHAGCIFIAWYCIRILFPQVNVIVRIISSSVCLLTIPDLFYVYMFFSECFLRFLVWIIFGLVVSYYNHKKKYKLLLLNMVSIYAFSVHQRCILLVAMTLFLSFYEILIYLSKSRHKIREMGMVLGGIAIVILFYIFEYKYAQNMYITSMYNTNGSENVGANLLSERGYTVKAILKDVIFNLNAESIAIQNMFGLVYYICSIDCGFVAYGFVLCFTKIIDFIKKRKIKNEDMPFVFICITTLCGILLVVYQMANEGVYERVELMHYGRYCSYLFAPMIMLGIVWILTEKGKTVRMASMILALLFLLSGVSTYNVLRTHNVTSLFAFSNACPGINSVYYTENPVSATIYHTLIGMIGIVATAIALIALKRRMTLKYLGEISVFAIIAFCWVLVSNREWKETHDAQNNYVVQTYDLQSVLENIDEFVAYKTFSRFGSGLLQYNNPYAKIFVRQDLDEFGEKENGLLVVSQKGIEEMSDIQNKYDVEYENDRYFIWKYCSSELK